MTKEAKGLGASARAAAVRAGIRAKIQAAADELPRSKAAKVEASAAKLGPDPKKQ